MKKKIIILDFAECKTLSDIHNQLKVRFGIKKDFNENWNYFWTCLEDVVCNGEAFSVELHHYFLLKEELKNKCRYLLEIFEDISYKNPGFSYNFIF